MLSRWQAEPHGQVGRRFSSGQFRSYELERKSPAGRTLKATTSEGEVLHTDLTIVPASSPPLRGLGLVFFSKH